MKIYLFTRVITKKEAINQYGKLGYTEHEEGIFIKAESELKAYEQLAPFNYKKHIKFKLAGETEGLENEEKICFNQIIDFGQV